MCIGQKARFFLVNRSTKKMLPGAYEEFYLLLRDALANGGPPSVGPADAVAVLQVIEVVQESAKQGIVIEMQM